MLCGALCLQHVHQSHGKKLSLRKARELAKTTRHGTTVTNLMSALEQLGYSHVRLKQRLTWSSLKRLVNGKNDVFVTWLSDLPSGNVAMPADGHYSVVRKVSRESLVLYDPDFSTEITLPRAFFWSRFYDFEIDRAGKRTDYLQCAIVARFGGK